MGLKFKNLKNSFAFVFMAVLGVCFLNSSSAFSQDYSDQPAVLIEVSKSQGRKIGIAIDDLQPIKAGGSVNELAVELPKRLSDNLELTGLFNSLDKRSFLESNKRAGIDDKDSLDYGVWSKIGANYLVKGGIGLSGSKLTLEMRLFDISTGKQILGKRYNGSVKDARKMINKFTNEVLLAITGEPGVFGSKIAFVTGDKSNRYIMMTEFGDDTAEKYAAIKGGPSLQPVIGFNEEIAWIHRNGKKWELLKNGKVISSGPLHISPAFKPDGSLVAAISGPNETHIYMISGQKNHTPLTFNGGINLSPTFSPDGSLMAYVSNQAGGAQIYVTSANGGEGRRITPGGKNTDPAWSPKGDKIVFVSRETDICVVNPDGSGFKQLTGGQGVNSRPSFSPDGRMILFTSDRYGKEQMFVMSANGDRQQPLMPDFAPNQTAPYWSPVSPN